MLIGNEILPSFLYAWDGEEITEIHERTKSTSESASGSSESEPSPEGPEKIQESDTTESTQEITESVPKNYRRNLSRRIPEISYFKRILSWIFHRFLPLISEH